LEITKKGQLVSICEKKEGKKKPNKEPCDVTTLKVYVLLE
jgi:hypothetical protein